MMLSSIINILFMGEKDRTVTRIKKKNWFFIILIFSIYYAPGKCTFFSYLFYIPTTPENIHTYVLFPDSYTDILFCH